MSKVKYCLSLLLLVTSAANAVPISLFSDASTFVSQVGQALALRNSH